MDILSQLSPQLLAEGHRLFGVKNTSDATKLIQTGKLSISFNKGTPDKYFIISGILLTSPQHEAKVSSKEGVLSSSCTCNLWTEEQHCPHTAALFLKFHLNHEAAKNSSTDTDPAKLVLRGGCHVDEYGTIIASPMRLNGAPFNATYAGLQYVLRDHRISHFPLVHNFTGIFHLYLTPARDKMEFHRVPHWEDMAEVHFSYIDQKNVEQKEISLFEYLYLFNWNTGDAFHLPDDIRDLVKRLKHHEYLTTVNDLIRTTTFLRQKGLVKLFWDNQEIDFEHSQSTSYRFSIIPTPKSNMLNLRLQVHDEQDLVLDPPEILQLFAMKHGYLESFRTKSDAARFIQSLPEILEDNYSNFRSQIHQSNRKDQINEWLQHAIHVEDTHFVYVNKMTQPYVIKNHPFLTMMFTLIKCFGVEIFKNSSISLDEKSIDYQIPKGQLFLGLSSFYQKLNVLNVPIFYHDKKVQRWTSTVKFERQNSEVDWFDLSMTVDQADMEIIRHASLEDDVVLTDKGLLLITDEQKEILKLMKKYTSYEKQDTEQDKSKGQFRFRLSFNRARIFELFELQKLGIQGALTPEEEKLCENLISFSEMPHHPVPENFLPIARNYQIQGYQWLRFLYDNRLGACLADDMGLGKTLQTIMFLQSLMPQLKRVLIVCPVSILMNWQSEIKKFSDFDAEIYYGGEREFNPNAKVYITSYGIMKREDQDQLLDQPFDVIIFDEVQHLKNVRSLGAHAARSLKANFRLCLTGTPVENDLSEFYNILDLALPGIWGEISFIRGSSGSKGRLLAKKVAKPFILRRTKHQVLQDLPDKEEHYVYLNFGDEERDQYNKKLEEIQSRLKTETLQKKYGEVLKSLLELRQLCLWQKPHHSTKIDYLMDSLTQILEEGHKVIIFSQFTTYLDLIQNRIVAHGKKFSRIDGSMMMKTRQKQVESFQSGDSQVFLISLKAGGVGLNLTAANYIFLMDPWWNPAVENQAIDRAYRIGQTRKVTVYRPVIKGSIEEKVIKLQNVKRDLFNELMSADDQQFYNGRLSMDDFKELLSLT